MSKRLRRFSLPEFVDRHRLALFLLGTVVVTVVMIFLRPQSNDDFLANERKACERKCSPRFWRLETQRPERAFQGSPRTAYKYPECVCY